MNKRLSIIGVVAYCLFSLCVASASDEPLMLTTSEFLKKFTPPISSEMNAALDPAKELRFF